SLWDVFAGFVFSCADCKMRRGAANSSGLRSAMMMQHSVRIANRGAKRWLAGGVWLLLIIKSSLSSFVSGVLWDLQFQSPLLRFKALNHCDIPQFFIGFLSITQRRNRPLENPQILVDLCHS